MKDAGIKVSDKIWMRQEDKWSACLEMAKARPETIFFTWFEESLSHLDEFFRKENIPSSNILMAKQGNIHGLETNPVVFAEHHPLSSKEQALYRELKLTEVLVFSALDEPLFKKFGSDKIVIMMKQLGMKETEAIDHPMITNAIRKAQEKIEKKIAFEALGEQPARSQSDWLLHNFRD